MQRPYASYRGRLRTQIKSISPQPPRPIEIFFHEVSGKYLSFHTDRETIDANPEGHTSVFVDFYPGRAAQENVTIYFVSSMLGKSELSKCQTNKCRLAN